jgi:hypothetical protein
MLNFVLNPGTKRRRRRKLSVRARRSRRASQIRRAYVRRAKRSAGRSFHRARFKTTLSKILCGPRSRARIRRWRGRVCKRPGSAAAAPLPALAGIGGLGAGSMYTSAGRNPRRRRRGRRGRNPSSARYSYRKHRRGGRRGGWRRFLNPGFAAGELMDSVKAPFNVGELKGVLPLVGGMIANNMARRWLGGATFMPAMLQSGKVGNLVMGAATAGLISAGIGSVMPGMGSKVLIGGLADVLMGTVNTLMGGLTGTSGLGSCGSCQGLGCVGCGALLMAGGSADGGVYYSDKAAQMIPSDMGQEVQQGVNLDDIFSTGDGDLY